MSDDAPILIADDEPNDALLLERAFRQCGSTRPIDTVSDGNELIAYFSTRRAASSMEQHPLPALILLDLHLPGRSGHEILQWRRTHVAVRHIPTVVFSGGKRHSDVTRAYELGANSYLLKPAGPEETLQLAQLLERYWLGMNWTLHRVSGNTGE